MRNLTETETRLLFEKLCNFVGDNIKTMLKSQNGQEFVFRLHNKKVYYLNKKHLKLVDRIKNDKLFSVGVCMAKFTHSGKLHLVITGLDYISQFAKYKIWVKQSNEMSFLYGNHLLKNGVLRMTQGTPKHQGVVIYNKDNTPLGIGITSKSIEESRLAKPTDVIVINQADTGFYLRKENVSTVFG